MVFSISSQKNNVVTFQSAINEENSWNSTTLSNSTESTMEMFMPEDKNSEGSIEWDIPELDITVNIGVWFEKGRLVDYDGVFDLPKEAIKLIRHSGLVVGRDFTING